MPLVLSLEQVLVAARKGFFLEPSELYQSKTDAQAHIIRSRTGAVYLADDSQHHTPREFSESEVDLERYVQERVQFFEERRLAGIEAKAMLKERHLRGGVDEQSVKPEISTNPQDETFSNSNKSNPTPKLKDTIHAKVPLSKKKQIKDASAHIFSHQKPVVATLTESVELAWFNPSSCAAEGAQHLDAGSALVARFLAGEPLTDEQFAFAKFKVFENLWERGYFLTSAVKFGGDFLLYPGDPLLHHASHVVVIVPMESKLTPFDIISYARMGRNAKKRILLMQYRSETRTVSEMDLNWTGWK
ncbi:tRNA-splicing endonuclease subunit Sen34 [Chytriomyces hyalinus]|nr:tRNA-splicing endonuclease subunit Sen34 [Chytriomyces hyalinus]